MDNTGQRDNGWKQMGVDSDNIRAVYNDVVAAARERPVGEWVKDGGVVAGAGAEGLESTGYAWYDLDSGGVDKGIHTVFCYSLSHAVRSGMNAAGKYVGSEALQDFRVQQAATLFTVSFFTAAKELWYDTQADGFDAAANYMGMGLEWLDAYHTRYDNR